MRIGLTYDLRSDYLAEGYREEETAEFDREDTIEAIEKTLKKLGYQTERIGHVKKLAAQLTAGKRWDMVFNICEGMRGIGREAQVPALLDAYGIPYTFSDTVVSALTLHKGLTKHIIRDLGIPTPDFVLINTPADIAKVKLPFPLFAKPVAEGTGKGISAKSKIKSQTQLNQLCRELLDTYGQSVLVERFLPGREFTVGIVGSGSETRAVGTIEVILKENAEAEVYSYVNKEKCEDLVIYKLVEDEVARRCEQVAVSAWQGLGCLDGGRVDVRLDENGDPSFLEVNPLAGLHPHHSDLPIICNLKGIPYDWLIQQIMNSACRRAGL